ncbi:MAG: hypothetical protein ABFS02_09165 [Pseudomonadota bacterium]
MRAEPALRALRLFVALDLPQLRAVRKRRVEFVEREAAAHQTISRRGGAVAEGAAQALARQGSSGCYPLDEFYKSRPEAKELKKLAKQIELPEREGVVATLLVLHRLEDRVNGVPDSWLPALEKAREWLEAVTVDLGPPDGGEWDVWFAPSI